MLPSPQSIIGISSLLPTHQLQKLVNCSPDTIYYMNQLTVLLPSPATIVGLVNEGFGLQSQAMFTFGEFCIYVSSGLSISDDHHPTHLKETVITF